MNKRKSTTRGRTSGVHPLVVEQPQEQPEEVREFNRMRSQRKKIKMWTNRSTEIRSRNSQEQPEEVREFNSMKS